MPATNEKKDSQRIIPAEESVYLDGPKSRGYELLFSFKVFFEFIKGFRTLHFVNPCIAVFGSARFKENEQYYIAAREIGKRIAGLGFSTMTGGGPGIMEAANRGAFEAGGESVGCNIILPHEQKENPYLTHSVTFAHFFVRKTMMIKYSYAFIIMPGGVGTMDEFYETLTLVQTRSIIQFPIVVYGKEFHEPLMKNIQFMADQGVISPEDMKLVLVTDDIDEAIAHIAKYITANYKVQKEKRMWWLFEKN